jgi:hypothetical protein
MKQLFLADLKDMSEVELRAHIKNGYRTSAIDFYAIHIAYEYEDSGGYGATSFFLLRHKDNKKFYVNYASHCSCNGFEHQFDPEEVTLEYLKSDLFYGLPTGAKHNEEHLEMVYDYIKNL